MTHLGPYIFISVLVTPAWFALRLIAFHSRQRRTVREWERHLSR